MALGLPGLLRLALLLLVLAPVPAARAEGRERVWGASGHLQMLEFVQGSTVPLQSSRYALLIQPQEHAEPIAVLVLELPRSFDSAAVPGSLRLCRMETWPAVQRTRCREVLETRLRPEGPGRLRIEPRQPLDGAHIYGLSLRLFNPSSAGLYPLRLFTAADPAATPAYLGTWLIPILDESE